jgi:hypothetical protein
MGVDKEGWKDRFENKTLVRTENRGKSATKIRSNAMQVCIFLNEKLLLPVGKVE